MPLLVRDTSRPKKYLSLPRSLMQNLCCRSCLTEVISEGEFPLRMTSSTYTRRAVKEEQCCLVKRDDQKGKERNQLKQGSFGSFVVEMTRVYLRCEGEMMNFGLCGT